MLKKCHHTQILNLLNRIREHYRFCPAVLGKMSPYPNLRPIQQNEEATTVCVGIRNLSIGSDNGFSPGRHQAIFWTNAGTLLIRTLGTDSSEILSEIHAFSFKKMRLRNGVHFFSASMCQDFLR